MAHKWADWLHNPCRLGGRNTSKKRTKSEVAHKCAYLHNLCRLGAAQGFKQWDKIRSGPKIGQLAA